MSRGAKTQTLPPFNNGKPLAVVKLDDGNMGVIDESNLKVWNEQNNSSTWMPHLRQLPTVQVPEIPHQYGRWESKSIGGVSKTVRCVGVMRCSKRTNGPVTLFAVHGATSTAVCDAFHGTTAALNVGDTEWDEAYGYVTEVIVHDPDDVAYAAAVIARTGATPMFEDEALNAKRCIGIERLDRIATDIMNDDEIDPDETYGLRRGCDNWRFPWIPNDWHQPPITWDHMVQNMYHENLEEMPQPLRQHVARAHIENGHHSPLGTRWTTTHPPIKEELDAFDSGQDAPPPLRSILSEEDTFPPRAFVTCPRSIVRCNGTWYRPCDARARIARHIPSKRFVSAALTPAQSKQLIEAFYGLVVECENDPETRHALCLILFHYMKERGYTARWMGKYVQDGTHVGNGDTFRNFARMSQYAPHRLPTNVLNKLLGRDGRLHNRGSKGSRSKKKNAQRSRYVPKRRLVRSIEDEGRMISRT